MLLIFMDNTHLMRNTQRIFLSRFSLFCLDNAHYTQEIRTDWKHCLFPYSRLLLHWCYKRRRNRTSSQILEYHSVELFLKFWYKRYINYKIICNSVFDYLSMQGLVSHWIGLMLTLRCLKWLAFVVQEIDCMTRL